jgi:hypothetical protein
LPFERPLPDERFGDFLDGAPPPLRDLSEELFLDDAPVRDEEAVVVLMLRLCVLPAFDDCLEPARPL